MKLVSLWAYQVIRPVLILEGKTTGSLWTGHILLFCHRHVCHGTTASLEVNSISLHPTQTSSYFITRSNTDQPTTCCIELKIGQAWSRRTDSYGLITQILYLQIIPLLETACCTESVWYRFGIASKIKYCSASMPHLQYWKKDVVLRHIKQQLNLFI